MKKINLILATFLTIILVTTLTTASLATIQQPSYFTKARNITYFTITANENITIDIPAVNLYIEDDEGDMAEVSLNSLIQNISAGERLRVNVTIDKDENFDPNFGIYQFDPVIITIFNQNNATINETHNIVFKYVHDFCEYGEVGKIEIDDVQDETKDNEDEWVWHPLDNIEIKINNVYNGFDEKKRIKVEYELYDSDGKKVDLDDGDNYKVVSIKDGDDKDIYFDFRIPADIDEGNYKLFVKAYIKSNEDEGCVSSWNDHYYQEVSIEKLDDRAVVIDEDELQETFESNVMCGDDVTLTAKVYNVGNEDEEKVLVNLYNKELGIDMDKVIDNLDAGEYALVSFDFKVPKNATEKTYQLTLTTYYDYDDSSSACVRDTDLACYDANSDEDLEKTFNVYMNVKGNCEKPSEKNVDISASLETPEEEVRGEKEITIKAILTNTGKKETTYTIGVEGYEDWANLVSISSQTITLNVNESKEVEIKLRINKGVEGEKTFDIKVLYDTEVKEAELKLFVNKRFSFRLPEIFRENKALLWITIVNIILIILIIIVAVKVAKKE